MLKDTSAFVFFLFLNFFQIFCVPQVTQNTHVWGSCTSQFVGTNYILCLAGPVITQLQGKCAPVIPYSAKW